MVNEKKMQVMDVVKLRLKLDLLIFCGLGFYIVEAL
jgi:hypothetical protein